MRAAARSPKVVIRTAAYAISLLKRDIAEIAPGQKICDLLSG